MLGRRHVPSRWTRHVTLPTPPTINKMDGPIGASVGFFRGGFPRSRCKTNQSLSLECRTESGRRTPRRCIQLSHKHFNEVYHFWHNTGDHFNRHNIVAGIVRQWHLQLLSSERRRHGPRNGRERERRLGTVAKYLPYWSVKYCLAAIVQPLDLLDAVL